MSGSSRAWGALLSIPLLYGLLRHLSRQRRRVVKSSSPPHTTQKGYNQRMHQVRSSHFPALQGDEAALSSPALTPDPGITYLDHAGATLACKSTIELVAAARSRTLLGNPHSRGPVASNTRTIIEVSHIPPIRIV